MCQLFETIKCEDGKLCNLEWHNQRMEKSIYELWKKIIPIRLEDRVQIPDNALSGLFRCRIIYANKIEKIEFIPYQFRQIRSLKIIEANDVDYHLKFTDRAKLDFLFGQRGDCDDILIVKNGFVTDSSTANPVFLDGNTWFTPDSVLLNGTKRHKLLHEGKITVRQIYARDVPQYQKTGLLNAFYDLENMPLINPSAIVF